jgi:hypothetical protein
VNDPAWKLKIRKSQTLWQRLIVSVRWQSSVFISTIGVKSSSSMRFQGGGSRHFFLKSFLKSVKGTSDNKWAPPVLVEGSNGKLEILSCWNCFPISAHQSAIFRGITFWAQIINCTTSQCVILVDCHTLSFYTSKHFMKKVWKISLFIFFLKHRNDLLVVKCIHFQCSVHWFLNNMLICVNIILIM